MLIFSFSTACFFDLAVVFFFASVSCQKHVRHSLAHQAPLLMMTIFLFSVNCRSVLFCVLAVFNAGPSQCDTREVGITITDNQWPWNAVYENRQSIEFKMLESNLTSAVSLFNYSTLINFRAFDRVLQRNNYAAILGHSKNRLQF